MGNKTPDKARTEMSVPYPAFSISRRKAKIIMNFIEEKIKPMYMKYLAAAFGSALI